MIAVPTRILGRMCTCPAHAVQEALNLSSLCHILDRVVHEEVVQVNDLREQTDGLNREEIR